MMEQHALNQEAVKEASIWLLPTDQLAKEELHGAIKHTSVVEGPVHSMGMVVDSAMLHTRVSFWLPAEAAPLLLTCTISLC